MLRRWFPVLLLAASGCAQPPVLPSPDDLLRDDLFAASSQQVSSADIFALSAPMKQYIERELAPQFRAKGVREALVDAATQGQLKLEYDAALTRTAAQAFDARAGNCLSLAIMVAAFAKAMRLDVHYNIADGDLWSRTGNIHFLNAHVNVSLARRLGDVRTTYDAAALMTIDFLPGEEIAGLRTHEVDERTIVAMFLNNRAAETLVAGHLDDAYWWAREAIRQGSSFMAAYNTLGVVYLRRGEPALAEHAFRRVLDHEPANTRALGNLAIALHRLGREQEATAAEKRLAGIEGYAPFYFFHRGLAAMEAGDYAAARELFTKELRREPDYHEFHFWLGLAELQLGDVSRARQEVAIALENSLTQRDRDLYVAKLDHLLALQRR